MGYKVNFLDNELIAAADLNAVASSLGGSASSFVNDTTYGVTDLNGISQTLVEKGVANGCTLSATNGVATIASGNLYMACGKRAMIDSDGISLPFTVGTAYYVYFNHDTVTGFVAPCLSATKPTTGDFVMIGIISATGQATSTPDKAIMKNSFLGTNKSETFTFTENGGGSTTEALLTTLSPTQVGYNRIILYSAGADNNYQTFNGFVDFTTGNAFSVFFQYPGTDGARAYTENRADYTVLAGLVAISGSNKYHKLYLRAEKTSDGKIKIYRKLVATSNNYSSYNSYTRTVTAILC